ncbi:MAG: hypothetical protein JNL35_02685 [Sphingopyxis sp.]|nr:hypothetical protein [Sphingopyxis sp.]
MQHTGLAVVESRWWSDGNDSVRPLFETLAGIVESNPHAVRYDMFAEHNSLSQIIESLCSSGKIHSIYIGAHGDDVSIHGQGDASISRTKLRNMFRKANKKGNVSGLFFGSCLVATNQNASYWLTKTSSTKLKWIAGYTKNVDWIESSAVDMIFWSKLLEERRKNRSRRNNKKTEIEIVKSASREMKKLMPTIFSEMGFNVYFNDSSGNIDSVW